MSENILNIGKWKDEYPFLRNVWTTYNDFDNDVDVNDYNSYNSLCYYVLKDNNEELIKYSNFCMKILRNLGYLSVVPKIYAPTSERCNMLYNWIYNSIDEKKITENIVDKCFEMFTTEMEDKGYVPNCSKLSYENYFEEPKKMTLLHIFEYNMQIIKDILKGKSDPDKIPWRKFICECVKIYKHMNDEYCPKREDNEKHESTCLRLDQFKESYELFRRNNGVLIPNIPSLDNIDNECFDKNSPAVSNALFEFNRRGSPGHSVGEDLDKSSKGLDGSLTVSLPTPLESTDSSMKNNITTTIGTVAGASSVLAFLYKFTPAGRLVNSRLRRIGGRTNNNFYSDRESELLFDEFAQGNINTYNIGYDAA